MILNAVLGVIVFTAVILILVTILNLAEARLLPQGEVDLTINEGEQPVKSKPGSTLLASLADVGIYLPSGCGGAGTCALCTCQVLMGGGQILPTETGHINRKEALDHWRLACQVKVKTDMSINIPPEILEIRKLECTVRSNRNVATFIKELILDLPPGERLDFTAGGYIQIYVPPYELDYKKIAVESEYRDAWDAFKLWQYHAVNEEEIFRAYSLANYPHEDSILMLNVRITTPPPNAPEAPPGIASSYIFGLKAGEKVTISGPYGEFFAQDTEREMVYIGGGAGMAPMRSHLYDLLLSKKTRRKISFWYGARSVREMFYDQEFRQLAKEFPNFNYTVALSEPMPEDNWDGPVGFIHQVVYDRYLKDHEDPTEIEYYMCGPPLMIDACDKMLYDLGVEAEMIAYDRFG